MLEIYNHLVSSYMKPGKNNSFSTDTKELKHLYNKMRNISMNSPLYKLVLSDERQEFALGIKEASLALEHYSQNLAGEGSDIFASSKTVSSDPDTAEVTSFPNSSPVKEPFLLKVIKLVTPQTNSGIPVNAQDASPLEGLYNFQIDADDESYSFKLKLSGNTSNEAVLGRLSDFINRTGIGLESSVHSDSSGKTIKLTIKSRLKSSGEPEVMHFSLKDINDKNNNSEDGIVSHYGLDNVMLESEGALFELNGELTKSKTNTFFLNNSIEVKLKKVSPDNITIGEMPDGDRIFSKVSDVLNSFNSLIKLADSNSTDKSARRLSRNLNNVIKSNRSELLECGIVQNADGTLSLDEEKAYEAAVSGKLKTLFSKDSKFYFSITQTASSITLNPMEYVDKTIVTYPDTLHTIKGSPYVSSIYSGMLFNYYC